MTVSSYDDVIYPSYTYPQTHPNHLSTVATLFGMQPAPAQRCRLLELGCAGGGNLLPLAEEFPDSEFVGIDLSARQVAIGLEAVRALQLPNLRLIHGSILDVDGGLGTFDYILCHGVYSWVPDEVREKILAICGRQLSPNGVAYVSYNTYPGWHMRGMLREIMCFHAARFTRPEDQVAQARQLLDFLCSAVPADGRPYGLLLKQEADLLRRQSDAYLYHEHLEEHNEPCYFFEFAQAAQGHGLQYLGDAAFQTMLTEDFPANVRETLQQITYDLIQMEQYLDFLRNRTFRASLLCHAGIGLNRSIDTARVLRLHFSTSAVRFQPEGDPAGKTAGEAAGPALVHFRSEENGHTMTTSSPLLVALMDYLGEAWPESRSAEEAHAHLAAAGQAPPGAEGREAVAGLLMRTFAGGVMRASAAPVRCVRHVSERPRAPGVARYLAAREGWAPSSRHEVCPLDELGRKLVPLLDGRAGHTALLEGLVSQVRQGALDVRRDGQPLREEGEFRQALAGLLQEQLQKLRRAGVLVG